LPDLGPLGRGGARRETRKEWWWMRCMMQRAWTRTSWTTTWKRFSTWLW